MELRGQLVLLDDNQGCCRIVRTYHGTQSRTDFWPEKFSTHGALSPDRVHTRTLYNEIIVVVTVVHTWYTVVHCNLVR